ncbi:MAG: HAMP domain-containing sensor histidine kinase [Pseudomonadota bacterium]
MSDEEPMSTKNESIKPGGSATTKLERLKTDASLLMERKKADLSIGESRKEKERKLDEEIAKDRLRSDKQLATERAGAVGTPEAADLHAEERRIADQERAANRLQEDEALLRKRQTHTAMESTIISEERMQTDISLRSERLLTDDAYAYAELLLAGERKTLEIAKNAVATRDEFLAIVSHDLRSPLSVILMCANELTKACTEKRLTELEAQWVDTILRYAANMGRLISDLLDEERMATGRLELARMPLDLRDLIKESVKSFQIWALKLEIKLSVDIAPNSHLVANIDSERIRQVLDNLISNAMKFTPRGGSVSVRAESSESEVRVSVTDTGSGIAEDQLANIFDRFHQIKHGDPGGVGMGLFIAKWIVESHNGKIWVESKPKSGSTFSFSLPHSHR